MKNSLDTLLSNFFEAGRRVPATGAPEELRKQLTTLAAELVHMDALEDAMATMDAEDANVQNALQDALEAAVEHPVLTTPDGRTYNARMFVLPVSQVVDEGAALQSLPCGEIVQQLLRDALCPSGIGILLNRFVSLDFLDNLTLQDYVDMAAAAAARVGRGSADEADIFVDVGPEVSSGLHMLVFIALAPVKDADALLSLDGDELGLQTSNAMDSVHDIVNKGLADLGYVGPGMCLHLPQPLFYEPAVVDLAHECFLCACAISGWGQMAVSEGSTLSLALELSPGPECDEIVVSAIARDEVLGKFCFAVDHGDEEMREQICLGVRDMAQPNSIAVSLKAPLTYGAPEAVDPRMLQLLNAPTRLQ